MSIKRFPPNEVRVARRATPFDTSAIVMIAAAMAIVYMLVYLIPIVKQIDALYSVRTPWQTQVLFSFSDAAMRPITGPMIVAAILATPIMLTVARWRQARTRA